jgi:hypothetical protein
MTKPASRSLASLNTRKASETPFTFEAVEPDGSFSGIKLSVLGSHSDQVTKESNRLINERRQQQAAREAQAGPNEPLFTPVEDDVAFGQRLAAVRLVGWEGIDEPCTPENALILCQTNPGYAAQVMQKSGNLANFTAGWQTAS